MLAGAVCGATLVAGAAVAQPEAAVSAHLLQIDRTLELDPQRTLAIVNRHGDVRLRLIPDAAEAELRVTAQSRAEVSLPVALEVERDDSAIRYRVVPGKHGNQLIRADLVVALPDRSAPVTVELADGSFSMHAAGFPVTLRAATASVTLRTSGRVDVSVDDGHVTYSPPGARAPAGGRIQTSGAPVDVLASDGTVLSYRVVSGAAVTTDSPALLASRQRDGRAVLFSLHPGAPVLEILTDHAPVRLVHEGYR